MAAQRSGVVLAAGFGSRLREADDAPIKPLVKVAGEAMIFRALRGLAKAGCDELISHILCVVRRDSDHAEADLLVSHDSRQVAHAEDGKGTLFPSNFTLVLIEDSDKPKPLGLKSSIGEQGATLAGSDANFSTAGVADVKRAQYL